MKATLKSCYLMYFSLLNVCVHRTKPLTLVNYELDSIRLLPGFLPPRATNG